MGIAPDQTVSTGTVPGVVTLRALGPWAAVSCTCGWTRPPSAIAQARRAATAHAVDCLIQTSVHNLEPE
jgi:hypothetical protein